MGDLVAVAFSAALSRFLAPRPAIRRIGNRLVVGSTWRTAMLTLGAVSHQVTIDPQDRLIRIVHRTGWGLVTTRWIRFADIAAVAYTYSDLLDSNWFSHTEQDLFAVGLRLTSGETVVLFRFYGEGDYINNSIWPDWMEWGSFLEAEITRGTQDRDSQRLVDVLCGLIGVPVTND